MRACGGSRPFAGATARPGCPVLFFDLELMLSDLKAAAGFVACVRGLGHFLRRLDGLRRDFVATSSFLQALTFGFVVALFAFGFAPGCFFPGLGGVETVRARARGGGA